MATFQQVIENAIGFLNPFMTPTDRAMLLVKNLSSNPRGGWNASTNTTTSGANLGVTPSAAGDYYDVTFSGNSTFAGGNFSSGQTFAIGDLIKSNGTAWYRIPGIFIPSDTSVGMPKLNADLTARMEGVGVEGAVVNYAINFDALTGQAGANNTWINNIPTTNRGKLISVRVKTVVGSTVTPYLYTVTGTSSPTITLLHTYPSFVTTSLEHTQVISDNYIVEAGQYIGFKSTGNWYTAGVGSGWSVGGNSQTSLTIAADFRVGGYGLFKRTTDLETQAGSNNTDVSGLITSVGLPGGGVNTSYPVDFVPLTSQAGANNTWINAIPTTSRGKLISVRVKTIVGSTVTPYVYSVVGTTSPTITLLHTYPSFVTTTLEQTQAITDPYVLEVGQYVGFKSTGNWYTGVVGSGWSAGSNTQTGLTIAYDFITQTPGYGMLNRVSDLETATVKIQAKQTPTGVGVVGDGIVPPEKLYLLGNWFAKGTGLMTITSGAEIRAIVSGTTSVSLKYTQPTVSSGFYPVIAVKYRQIGSAFSSWTRTTTTSGTNVLTLISSLTATNAYEVRIAVDVNADDLLWAGAGFTVNSINISAGGSYSVPVKQVDVAGFGDSITAGVLSTSANTSPAPAATGSNTYAEINYFHLGCESLNAAPHHNAFGGTGITVSGAGGIPQASASLLSYMANTPKTAFVDYKAIVNNWGQNDGPASSSSFKEGYRAYIRMQKQIWPSAKIVLMRPFSGAKATEISALASEEGCLYMDTSSFTLVTTTDGVHPNVAGHAAIAPQFAAWMKTNLSTIFL